MRPAVDSLERRALLATLNVAGQLDLKLTEEQYDFGIPGFSDDVFRGVKTEMRSIANLGVGGRVSANTGNVVHGNNQTATDQLNYSVSAGRASGPPGPGSDYTIEIDGSAFSIIREAFSHPAITAGVDTGGSPIIVSVQPSPGDQVGARVSVVLELSWDASIPIGMDVPKFTRKTDIASQLSVGYTAQGGPIELLSQTITSADANAEFQVTKRVTIETRIGEQFQLTLDHRTTGSLCWNGVGTTGPQFQQTIALNMSLSESKLPDLVATSLTWNSQQGGVDFRYEVKGADLPVASTVALYWSSDPSFDKAKDTLIAGTVTTTQTAVGTYGPIRVTSGQLSTPPKGTKYLLAVADPDDKVAESDETNNVKALARIDIAPTSLTWADGDGGVDFAYKITGGNLIQDTTVDFYWAKGPTFEDRIGKPFHQEAIKSAADKTEGDHSNRHLVYSKVPDPPISLVPKPKIDATYVLVVAGQDHQVNALPLQKVIVGAGFKTKLADVGLDTTLLRRFMTLAGRLVAHNLVSDNISLDSAVRDPKQAHSWSTTYSILISPTTDNQLLKNLQALPGGKDMDGKRWYNKTWEQGTRNSQGNFTQAGLTKLWKKIREQAKANSADRSANAATLAKPAAEGYKLTDPRVKPNTYAKVSKHCVGLAIDATVPWRSGAKLGSLTIANGMAGDNGAITIVGQSGLSRPLLTITPVDKREPWHFELK
jgi:hypothetical protein